MRVMLTNTMVEKKKKFIAEIKKEKEAKKEDLVDKPAEESDEN